LNYLVKKGTVGKLIEINPNQDAVIKDWTLRKEIVFSNSLIDPIVVKTMVEDAQKSLAGTLAKQGYALFGGDSGNDRKARFVLAVPYDQIELVP